MTTRIEKIINKLIEKWKFDELAKDKDGLVFVGEVFSKLLDEYVKQMPADEKKLVLGTEANTLVVTLPLLLFFLLAPCSFAELQEQLLALALALMIARKLQPNIELFPIADSQPKRQFSFISSCNGFGELKGSEKIIVIKTSEGTKIIFQPKNKS